MGDLWVLGPVARLKHPNRALLVLARALQIAQLRQDDTEDPEPVGDLRVSGP